MRVVNLATPLGSARVLLIAPRHPRASLVMLPGGAGEIGLAPDGRIRHGANFLVRTRADWLRRGYAVLIPDAPGGRNLRGLRRGSAMAGVTAQLIALARREFATPVFLVGTSQGAIAAVNGAAHAPQGALAGLILTESVSIRGHSGETVFDADPAQVRVPVLIVANLDDRCRVAPPTMTPRIARALSAASGVSVVMVSGGRTVARPCGSRSPHGYAGIEPRVETIIARWIDARLPSPAH